MNKPIVETFNVDSRVLEIEGASTSWAAPVALFCSDLASFAVVYLLIHYSGAAYFSPEISRLLALCAVSSLLLFAVNSLYPGYQLHHHEHLRRRVVCLISVAGAGAAAAFFVLGSIASATLVLVFMGLAVITQPFLRSFLRLKLHDADVWGLPVEIYGEPDRTALLVDYFKNHWEYGIVPKLPAEHVIWPPIDPPQALARPRSRMGLVATIDVPTGDQLAILGRRYDSVLVLADMPDLRATGLPSCGLGGRIAITLGRGAEGRSFNYRRLFDLAVALPAAVFALPLIGIAALILRVIDPGPVFFRQAREGLNGRTIQVLKLRTMYRDADARLENMLASDPEIRAQWLKHFKLKNDPRILPGIGPFLRVSSFDELPQLLNVIRGDMSIVGPRPFPLYHLKAMDAAFRQKRCTVTPGLTGLWQVSERSNADVVLQQQLDGFYIDNRSFWFDLYIIMRTVSALIRKSGD